MFEFKRLSRESIPRAVEKADWYRLLNDPHNAESICRDVLLTDADNLHARVTLILSLTDQFSIGLANRFDEAMQVASMLPTEYEQHYYTGIVCERRAKNHYQLGGPGCGSIAYEWFQKAMGHFADAEKVKPEGNDESLLRWNACARMIMNCSDIKPPEPIAAQPIQLE